MNKNLAISLAVILVVLGGGYYLTTHKTGNEVAVPGTETSVTKTPTTTSPAPVTNPKVDAPTVETSSNVGVSNSTAIVTGQVVPNGAPTTYWFEYGETTGLGQRTTTQQVGSGFTLTPTPGFITGLKSNTVYYFRLSANNRLATVNGATYSFQTNNIPPPKAVAPTTRTVSAGDVQRTSAILNGQVNPNGWQTNYWFEYGTDSTLGNITTIVSAGDGTSLSNVSMSLTSLQPLTKYFFRLNAQNIYGTINGTTLNFTTGGPAAPSAPTVTTNSASNVGRDTARLNGHINPNGVETTYWFEYGQTIALDNIVGSVTGAQTLGAGSNSVSVNTNISNLNRNSKYFYRLIGRNQYGTIEGNVTSFTTH